MILKEVPTRSLTKLDPKMNGMAQTTMNEAIDNSEETTTVLVP